MTSLKQTDWTSYSTEQIKTDTSEGGVRLVTIFCREYKQHFGPEADCCHACPSFIEKVRKLINRKNQMAESKNSGYVLKEKYNGTQVPKVSKSPLSNLTLTYETAKKLKTKFPDKDWFESEPKTQEPEKTWEDQVKGMLKDDLKAEAERLNLETDGTVPELKARILENGETPDSEEEQ